MIKGVQRNFNPEATPEGFALLVKNAIISEKWDAILNDKGTVLYPYLSTLNIVHLLAVRVLGTNIIIWYNTATKNEIAVIEQGSTVTVKVSRTDLNFNPDFPLSARAKFNPKGEIIVAFVDGNNTTKYINLDTASSGDALSSYNLFPISQNPNINASVLENGGSVPTGAYYVSVQYISDDRAKSQWSQFSKPIYITDFSGSADFTASDGSEGGAASNQGIRITLSELDPSYNKVAIAIISKVAGVVSARIIKEVSYTPGGVVPFNNTNTLWTGTEFLSEITIEEIITKQPIYETAKHIVDINDELVLADLTTLPINDLQTVANSLTVKWRSTFKNTDYRTDDSSFKNGADKTFMHDEVCALYIEFELTNGRFTPAYHIPGRAVFGNERNASNLAAYSGGITIAGSTPKIFQVQDTSLNDGYESIAFGSGTGFQTGYRGSMGFWENQNETYPNDPARWGSLAGQKVRHHKFPSIATMNTIWNNHGYTNYGIDNLDTLGIDIGTFTIPVQYASLIKGYRISYAKRDYSNAAVLGYSLVQFGANIETTPEVFNSTVITSAAGNFRINSQTDNTDDLKATKSYIRLNAFDIMLDKPAVSDIYIDNVLKLRINNLGFTQYSPTSKKGRISHGINAGGGVDVYSYFSNFTLRNDTIKSPVSDTDRLRKISNSKYIPANTVFNDGGLLIRNLLNEEALIGKIEGAALDLDIAGDAVVTEGLYTNAGTYPGPVSFTLFEEVYLCAVKVPRSDYFLGFENQTLVPISRIARSFVRQTFMEEGEGFIGTHSFIALAPVNDNDAAVATDGVRNPKLFLAESRHNLNLRYKTDGDYSTYFYPSAGAFLVDNILAWQVIHDHDLEWNKIQYNKDYTTIDEYQALSIYNPNAENSSLFPYRLVKSKRASSESSLEDGWRQFLAGDYFDTVRNKGLITNLEAWGTDILLVHHEKALFRTRDRGVLETGSINVTLGRGGLFSIDPEEERPNDVGYAGTQHKFACHLSEAGYFFPDADTGEVFLFNGTLQNITKGLRLFFRDEIERTLENKPFYTTGMTSAFDKANYRILISHKGVNNWMWAYDLIKQEWSTAHDTPADYIFNDRNYLMSFKDNNLYTHGLGPRGNYYGTVYPTYVDIIINENPDKEKILAAINFIAKQVNADGSINTDKSLTHITIWNDKHCSGRIPITVNNVDSLMQQLNVNSKVKDEMWSFNDFFNRVKTLNSAFVANFYGDYRPIDTNLEVPAWYNSEPLRGKYFIIRLEYDNLEDKEIQIRKVIPILKESYS